VTVLGDLGLSARFRPVPDEVERPIPFAEDRQHASYDPEQAHRFWRVLLQADRILKRFRGRFVRQVQSGALLLGQLRSRAHALLGAAGARATRREPHDARGDVAYA